MKKIIAVMVALMFAAVLFNINVSAMSESSFSRQYVDLLSDYKNGYIVVIRFVCRRNFMKIALKCKKIICFLFSFGLITMLMIPN